MRTDVLYNFISPITGRILCDSRYVIVGNNAGIGIPSPALIDLNLEIIQLRQDYGIAVSATFVIGQPNAQLPNAQVLNALSDGFMVTTAGVVSTVPISIVAPADATYIIQTVNAALPNSQALVSLGTGMAKIVSAGAIAIAVPDGDYVSYTTLQTLIAEATASANSAATSASFASASAVVASTSETLASGSASVASASASFASSSATAAFFSNLATTPSVIAAGFSAFTAGISATSAVAQAAGAAGSAVSAATSASNASTSATNAATSEANAAISAANSATSSSSASASAVSAAASAASAAALATSILATQFYGNIYMSGNSTTTTLPAATDTKILGTTTSGSLSGFTMPTNNQLQYTGTPTINTFVTANVSISHNVLLGTTVGISIYKNGTLVLAPSATYQLMPNVLTQLSVSVYVSFATNDYVEVYMQTVDASTSIAVNMNLLVSVV